MQLIINADDFGVSRGVNEAIVTAHQKGILNSTSMMMNVAYTDDAIRLAKTMPDLKIGVHLNLTNQRNQKPLANPTDIPLLVDKNGHLKNGFVALMLLSFRHPKQLAAQAALEMRAQIDKLIAAGIQPAHLDSHRHVHMIPALFKTVTRLASEYNIPRVRVVNESFYHTFRAIRNPACFWDGGVIKYALLKFFYYLNRTQSPVYFYSILYTTRLFGRNMRCISVPRNFEALEVGTHPSIIATDAASGDPHLDDYLLRRRDRLDEFSALLIDNLVIK